MNQIFDLTFDREKINDSGIKSISTGGFHIERKFPFVKIVPS